MIEDPWATNVPTTKENTDVSNTTEDAFTITLKQSGGYESPWVVIRSGSAEEAKLRLQSAMDSGLFDVVNQAVGSFSGKTVVKAAFQPAPSQGFSTPAQPTTAPQGGDGRMCSHNVPMAYRTGVNQNSGKEWKAYFCGTPKGTPNQCKAVFI